MTRKEWMLPREDSIGRSLNPQPTGRTAGGRRTKRVSMLLALAAAALILSSAAVLISEGDGKETAALQPEIPGSSADIPPPPFIVYGYTYAADGSTPLPDCTVTITNVNTGAFAIVSSGSISFYNCDISAIGYTVGDTIHVLAEKGELYGENEGVIPGGANMALDIVLNQVIPEFPMVLVPVVGMVALLAVIRLRRKK